MVIEKRIGFLHKKLKCMLTKTVTRLELVLLNGRYNAVNLLWGGGGGGGGGGNGDDCSTGVRASISKPTPFIYLAFEEKWTHSYT